MKIVITDRVPTETAIIGLGVVKEGDVVDANDELAHNLIKEGRAQTAPPSQEDKAADKAKSVKVEDKPKPAAEAKEEA